MRLHAHMVGSRELQEPTSGSWHALAGQMVTVVEALITQVRREWCTPDAEVTEA